MTRRSFAVRPVSLAAAMLVAAPGTFALPQGAVPVFGQTTVQQTAPGQLVIDQTTARAGIDWTSFSIASGERVLINQPGTSSVLVNRVTGNDPSKIFGQLQSNGSVWLINPRGIVFGANARVDVGSLVASTLSITQDDVANGRLVLGKGAGAGTIVNEGQITARNGTVVLAAPEVTHSGTITARRAGIVAATDVTVDVEGDGLIFFNARNDGTLDTRLSLLGNVLADGGTAEVRAAARAGFADTVLNLQGVVQARSMGQRNGRIVIDGGDAGVTSVGGALDASGRDAGESGGDVVVTGRRVMLDSSARIDASGDAGGGRVRAGGGWHGADADVRNAEQLVARPGARIEADALTRGNGGEVVLWSDQVTRFHGAITARGGATGGDGGNAEVSGRSQLDFAGTVDLRAPQGSTGTLLLDPLDIRITATGNRSLPNTVDFDDGSGSAVYEFKASDITDRLKDTNLKLQATQDIKVEAAIGDASSDHLLELEAGRNIEVKADITATGVTLKANADFFRAGPPPVSDPAAGTGFVQVDNGTTVDALTGTLLITNQTSSPVSTGTHVIGGTLRAATITIEGPVRLTENVTWVATSTAVDSAVAGVISDDPVPATDSDQFGITKDGAGRLVLGGTNEHNGAMRVVGGTLAIGADRALGAVPGSPTAGSIVLAGGTLEVTDNVALAANRGIAIGDGVSAGSGTLSIANGKTLTVTATVSDNALAGTLVKSGSGTLVLNADNAYTGGTRVQQGTLQIDRDRSLGAAPGSTSAGNIVLAGGTLQATADVTLDGNRGIRLGDGVSAGSGTLSADATHKLTVNGVIADNSGGAGSLVVAGAGTVALAQATSTYTGGTTLQQGTLQIDRDRSLGATGGDVLLSGGTLEGTATLTLGSGRDIALAGGQLAAASGTTMTIDGVVSDQSAAATLVKTGAGTVALTGINTYSGGTVVQQGTLQISRERALGAVPGAVDADNVVLAGGTLEATQNVTLDSRRSILLGAGGAPGSGTLSATTGATLAVSGSVGDNGGFAGALVKSGPGTVTLQAGNGYTGGTTVTQGVLSVAADTALGPVPGAAAVNVVLAGGTLQASTNLSLDVNRRIALGDGAAPGGGTLAADTGATFTIAGRVVDNTGGAGSLTIAGSGSVALAAGNTYTGGTTLSAGTLAIADDGALGTVPGAPATSIVLAGGTLRATDDVTLDANRTVALASGTLSAAGGKTLTVAGLVADNAGAGSLTIGGTGTVVLGNAGNSYTGNTTISQGTLSIASDGALGTVPGSARADSIVLAGGTLSASTALTLDARRGIALGNGSNGVGGGTLAGAGGTLRIDGAIDDNGSSTGTLVTSGSVVLAADNGYLGTTTVGSGGTLTLGAGAGTGSAGAGTITIDGALVVDRTGTLRLAQAIDGSGSLTKNGGGTLELAATNSYGNTVVNTGTLSLVNGAASATGTLGSGTLTINSPGTLEVARSGTVTLGSLNGNGTLLQSGTGTTERLNASTFSGTVSVTGGTLAVGNNDALGTATVSVGSSGRLELRGVTFDNALTVGGGTVSAGTGGGTLDGTTTTIADGSTLRLRSDSGSTLTVTGGLGANPGTAADEAVRITAGTVQLQGTSTYAGATSVDTLATLQIASGAVLGGAVALDSNATLELLGGTFGSTVSVADLATIASRGAGGATLGGAGTLVLADGATLQLQSIGGGTLTVARAIDSTAGAPAENVHVTGGTVTVTADNGYGGTTTVDAGARLNIGNGAASAGSLGAGAVTLTGNATLAFNRDGTSLVSQTITGSSATLLQERGTTQLTAANTLGSTQITGGTLQLGTGGGSGSLGASSVQITSPGVLLVNRNDEVTLGVLSGNGTLNVNGTATGAVRLATATSPFTGAIDVDAGTLRVAAADAAGSGTVTLAGGTTLDIAGGSVANTVTASGSSATISASSGTGTLATGTLNLATNSTLHLAGPGTLTVARAIPATSGVAVTVDSGTVVLAAAASQPGDLTVATNATLAVAGGGSVAGKIVLADEATLELRGITLAATVDTQGDARITADTSGGTLSAAGALNLLGDGSTLTLAGGSGSGTLTVARAIGQAAGALAEAVTVSQGTVTLAATNTYEGTTTVQGGTRLNVGNGTTGTLGSGNVALAGTLSFNRSGSVGYGGVISGAGTLRQDGSGLLSLSADSSPGNTVIASGQLQLGTGGSAGSVGSSGITIAPGAALVVNRSDTITLGTLAGSGDLVAAGGSNSVVRLASAGSGFSGRAQVTAGTLRVAAGNALGSGSIELGSHTLDITGGQSVANALSAADGATITSSTGGGTLAAGTLTLADGATLHLRAEGGNTLTVNRVIADLPAGSAESVAVDAGHVVIGAAGTYTGGTSVAGTATLQVDNAGRLGTGGVSLAGGSRLDLTGGAVIGNAVTSSGATLANGSGSGRLNGTLSLGAATTLDVAGDGLTLGGTVNGAGSLQKTGTGTLTLAAAAAHTGGTTVSQGRLNTNAANQLPANRAVAVDSNATLALAGSEALGALTGGGTVTVPIGATLAVTIGPAGSATFDGLINGAGGIAKTGDGTWQLTRATQGWGGATSVQGGTLQVSGTLPTTTAATVGTGATLQVDQAQTVDTLTLSGALAGAGSVSATNGVTLAGGTVNAALGGGTLTVSSGGTLNATSAATIVNVDGGTLSVTGANRFTATPDINVASGATLDLTAANSGDNLDLSGRLQGSGPLTVATATLNDGAIVAGALVVGGTLTSAGDARIEAQVGAGTLAVTQDTLTLAAADLLADGTAVTVAGPATLVLGGNETVATLGLTGTLSGPLGGPVPTLTAGTVTLGGGTVNTNLAGTRLHQTGGSSTLNGTSSATVVDVDAGTLTLGAANRLADDAVVTVTGPGTLMLGGNDTVDRLALNANGTIDGTGTLTATRYDFDGGIARAALGGGTLNSVGASRLESTAAAGTVNVTGGNFTVTRADGLSTGANVLVRDATLRVTGDTRVGSLTLERGSLVNLGGGTFDASTLTLSDVSIATNLGTAALIFTGTNTLSGEARAGAVTVGAGSSLTLVGGSRLTAQPLVTVNGTLTTGGSETLGTLSGSGSVQLGGTLTTGTQGSSVFSGTMGGSGGLQKAGGGTFTFAGSGSYGGSTTVSGGTLAVTGTLASLVIDVADTATLSLPTADRLADGAAVTVARGGTLTLAANERVGTLDLQGLLGGTGTLTAGTTTLSNGGRAEAALGGGTLVVGTGGGTLAGRAASDTVNVNADTLTLGSAGRFSAGPAVTVATGATLALAGDESFGTLAGGGRVALGSATLTTGNGNDSDFGGTLDGTGALVKRGSGRFTLSGTGAHTGGTTVAEGTLVLPTAERLADGARLTVERDATLQLAQTETVATATLRGTASGAGTLVAPVYTLDGATVNATLGAGSLTSTGDTTVNGSSQATNVQVDGGTLRLQGSNRLATGADVTVGTNATLALAGDQTLRTLAGSGTVDLGSATLRTGAGDSSFAGTLQGSGGLVKQGAGNFTLSGAASYTGSTEVAAGTLTLAGADRLADATAVTVRRDATLALGGNDRVASLDLEGTLDGSGTLTAARYTLGGGTANANLGAGTLTSTGNSRIAGTVAAGTLSVDGGTLTLAAADRLADDARVTVSGTATLTLNGNDRIERLELAGVLDGTGTVNAQTSQLDGGRVDAGLAGGTLDVAAGGSVNGTLAVSAIDITGGTLQLATAGRLLAPAAAPGTATVAAAAGNGPAVTVRSGTQLALGGNETLGTLEGGGTVNLGSATLAVGSGGDSSFGGVIGGTGGLVKQGTGTFTLTGASTYTGVTRVDAGTLALGNGGSTGSLQTSAFDLTGTLRIERNDAVTLATAASGSGGIELAGGTLTLAGQNKSYSGGTVVTAGKLVTADADNLPDTGTVRVAGGASLELGGAERIGALDADGGVLIHGTLAADGALRFGGAVSVSGQAPVQLSGTDITALNAGNDWGGALHLDARGTVAISSGSAGSGLRDLSLGTVSVAGGGSIAAGRLSLDGPLTVSGSGTRLELSSDTPYASAGTPAELAGKKTPGGSQIAFAADVVTQGSQAITVNDGATLAVHATGGGSVELLNAGNRFNGGLEVISGNPAQATPWEPKLDGSTSVQSRVRVEGSNVRVAGKGIEADVVEIRADSLSTAPGAVIAARLPFDNTAGARDSVPALTLELTPQAFALAFPFGQQGSEINISVGSRAWGNRSFALDAGYITVLPRGGAQGATAVILTGPQVAGGYSFFFDGAGDQAEIPVFYNGVLPNTPQFEGSISATLAVSESARRQGFEEAVRTENVATRLRSGVIAEVGPGRPATVGTEGARLPQICPPAGATLGCGATP